MDLSFLSGNYKKKAGSGGGQFDFLSGRAGKRASSAASSRKVWFKLNADNHASFIPSVAWPFIMPLSQTFT